MIRISPTSTALIVAWLWIATGCGSTSDDAKIAALAIEAADRQADQNRQMAELQQHVAQGTEELVTADAEARKELASLSLELQAERSEVGRQRDELESERKTIARQRHLDPLIAAAITHACWVIACLLPLIFCIYLIRRPANSADDALVAEFLISDICSAEPLVLPSAASAKGPPQIDATAPPAITDQTTPSDEASVGF